jgi:hypothetical protein
MTRSTKVTLITLGFFVTGLLVSQLVLGLLMLAGSFFGSNIAGTQRAHMVVGNTSVILVVVYVMFSLSVIRSMLTANQKLSLTVLGVVVTLLLVVEFTIGLFFGYGITPILLISHLITGNMAILLALIYVWLSLWRVWSIATS